MKGFKLFQPWASDVINGKMKYLVRSFPTRIRGKVAVIASKGIDGKWFESASDEQLARIENRVGVLGIIEIENCFSSDNDLIEKELKKLGGTKYLQYYPKYLIPNKKSKKLYIWTFKNAEEWDEPLNINIKGMKWVNLDL